LSLGGSRPYTSTEKKGICKHKRNNTKHSKYKYTFTSLIKTGLFWRLEEFTTTFYNVKAQQKLFPKKKTFRN